MTAGPSLTFIPDLVEEHFDELQFLWATRRRALRSPTHTERALHLLEERIAGRVEAMLVVEEADLLEFVEPALAAEDELPAFAAGMVLSRLATPAALIRLAAAFEAPKGAQLGGLRDAIAASPPTELMARLTLLFQSASPAIGAAAGEVLAFHGAVAPAAASLERFVRAGDPTALASALRLAAYCATNIPIEWYEAGLRHDDPRVKNAALTAAAWNAPSAFVSHCRTLAAEPTAESIDALALYAATAPPEEYQFVGSVASNPNAGPERFRLIGAFAHPYFIELLIAAMESPDPAAATAAGTAFGKMTGRDLESDKRAKIPLDGKPPADDFEAEFQDEVFLPDPELARKHWQELAPTLARSPRICRGMDVSQPLSREQFALLDMESRWEYCLRMRLSSGWQGTPLVLERYPQRF